MRKEKFYKLVENEAQKLHLVLTDAEPAEWAKKVECIVGMERNTFYSHVVFHRETVDIEDLRGYVFKADKMERLDWRSELTAFYLKHVKEYDLFIEHYLETHPETKKVLLLKPFQCTNRIADRLYFECIIAFE